MRPGSPGRTFSAMKILALDVSTKSGWALLDGEMGKTPTILLKGTVVKSKKTTREYGRYPKSYLLMADEVGSQLANLFFEHKPDVVVIEETNKARARYAQKALEQIHHELLKRLGDEVDRVIYISSSSWRKACGLNLTKEDKKNNQNVQKAKRTGQTKSELGVRGKVTKKHLAIRKANELFSLDLKVKDNDIADALLLCVGYLLGASTCDGIKEFA